MPNKEQLRNRLINKLKELFQMDQPDLDFGFYRIMHAKADMVTKYLEKDLFQRIEDTFGESKGSKRAELEAEYQEAVETANRFKIPNPEESEPVLEVKAKLDALGVSLSAEAEVYDHLYRFFERYYDKGDFISRRYYARETDTRAAPYAIPYHGEEVKLVWANMDQYYIKTTEHFSNFTFDLMQASEVLEWLGKQNEGLLKGQGSDYPDKFPVHFRIVDATEGEHGNVKASEDQKRFFVLYREAPLALEEEGLVIRFEFRPVDMGDWTEELKADAEKKKTPKPPSQDDLRAMDSGLIIQALKDLGAKDYLQFLKLAAPTEKQKDRVLLDKYLYKYTTRNTSDYFIHKDLGGFLRRELDFYLKNEVMRLDDIQDAEAPSVESYLEKLKVIRTIGQDIITFLAQLEDFQKKLWLKKKFVVETNYCITLDRIPEEFYSEIAANDKQRDEWVELFSIDQIIKSEEELDFQGNASYSVPLSIPFLKGNKHLIIDTRWFDISFKQQVVSSIQEISENILGFLFHSENFQALSLLGNFLENCVDSIYIDPPYNTDAGPISYKNGFRDSSWISMMGDRLVAGKRLLAESGMVCCTIDDYEHKNLGLLMESVFDDLAGTVAIRIKPSGRPIPNGFAVSHEYGLFSRKNPKTPISRLSRTKDQLARYREKDGNGSFFWEMLRKAGSNSTNKDRPTMYFPIYLKDSKCRLPKMSYNPGKKRYENIDAPLEGEIIVWPEKDDGTPGCWYFGYDKMKEVVDELKGELQSSGKWYLYYRRRPNLGVQPTTVWSDAKYSATEHGTALLKKLFKKHEAFTYPKSIYAVEDSLRVSGVKQDSLVLDYFAGSGTTGHAVINLNREDNGNRRFYLVEMGNYFDEVTLGRIKKVLYCSDWKGGSPKRRTGGLSAILKYQRLESYEDTLNNLVLSESFQSYHAQTRVFEDYLLKYFLDKETVGSPSLLNVESFNDPEEYYLKVKQPGTDAYSIKKVDLLETFNYLIGLRVQHIEAPETFSAEFERLPDPDLPDDQETRLQIKDKFKRDPQGPWWFRKVVGWIPRDPERPNNGEKLQVLIVWRKLTGDLEKDNLMLDEWFRKKRISTRDFEFDLIYVNGSNNLPNLRQDDENWKVKLLEEEFMYRMWDTETV